MQDCKTMEKKNRIILFWALTILGFLTHSLADALPAFWGQSIAAQPGPAPVGMMAIDSVKLCQLK